MPTPRSTGLSAGLFDQASVYDPGIDGRWGQNTLELAPYRSAQLGTVWVRNPATSAALLRILADVGDEYTARQLAELLAQRGDLDGLRVLADAADEYAAWLAEAARRAPSAEFADPQKTGTTRKVCATCGSQLTADDLYCGECGTSTRSTKSGRSLTS